VWKGRTISVFVGFTDSPWFSHHFSTRSKAACITLQTVAKSKPSTRIEKSSAYPCAKYAAEFSARRRPSATRIHMRAESTPPCGNPLCSRTFIVISPEVALAILVDSVDLIQSITVLLTLFDRRTFNKEPDEALLNAFLYPGRRWRPTVYHVLPSQSCWLNYAELYRWIYRLDMHVDLLKEGISSESHL